MSATLAPGKQYVSNLLLTFLIIESPITRVVGEAAGGGGGDCAPGEGTDDGGWEEQERRRARVKFSFEQWCLGREDHPGMFGKGLLKDNLPPLFAVTDDNPGLWL